MEPDASSAAIFPAAGCVLAGFSVTEPLSGDLEPLERESGRPDLLNQRRDSRTLLTDNPNLRPLVRLSGFVQICQSPGLIELNLRHFAHILGLSGMAEQDEFLRGRLQLPLGRHSAP
jgi:hypothetical protein